MVVTITGERTVLVVASVFALFAVVIAFALFGREALSRARQGELDSAIVLALLTMMIVAWAASMVVGAAGVLTAEGKG